MFTEKDLVFPISKPKGTMYLKEVLEYENSFLKFLEGKAQPINAAYVTYASRIKAGASLAEVEGLAQVVQYIESLPAAKQKDFMHTIHTELKSALCNVEIAPDETTFFYKDGTAQTVDIIGPLTNQNYTTLNDTALIKAMIGQHITTIEFDTFCDCDTLTSITIPDSVITIKDNAFCACTSLISAIIPDSVNTIGVWAFYNCSSLAAVTLPNNIKEIENYVFNNCTSLTSIIIPSSVKIIRVCAFCDCTSLASVIISNGVTTIEKGAFVNCTSLTSVTIPNSVTEIGERAFADVLHITYHGNALGAPWGALTIN